MSERVSEPQSDPWNSRALIDDGRRPTKRDCRKCGAPILVLDHYGEPEGEIMLDALPLRAFTVGVGAYGGHTLLSDETLHAEHACPVFLSRPSEVSS